MTSMASDDAKVPEAVEVSEAPARARRERHAAPRTCVGCRAEAPREELVRFALHVEDGVATLVPDLAHKLGGRGASVHPTRACIELGVKRGGFAKAASARVDASAAELVAMLEGQILQRARGLLLGAVRAKLAVLGADATEKAIAARKIESLVIATDASARTGEIKGALARLGGRAIEMLGKAELGALVGRDEVAVIGISDEGIGGALAQVAELLRGVRGQADSQGSSGDPMPRLSQQALSRGRSEE